MTHQADTIRGFGFGAEVQFEQGALRAAMSGTSAPPKFSSLAYAGGPMRVGYYSDPTVIDVSGLRAAAGNLPVLRQHNMDELLGHTVRVDCSGGVVRVEGILSGGSYVPEVVQLARNGFPWHTSIACVPEATETLAAGASAKVNGKTVAGPAIIVRAGVLYEVSFTPLPADFETDVSIAAALARAAQCNLIPPTHAAAEHPQVLAIRAELARIAKIEAIARFPHTDIRAQAIAEGWSAEQTIKAILKRGSGK